MRFVNHSCQPNLLAVHAYVGGPLGLPSLCFFAMHDVFQRNFFFFVSYLVFFLPQLKIKEFDELTASYSHAGFLRPLDPRLEIGCACGERVCRARF